MSDDGSIVGFKGGEKQRAPIEAPDSLYSTSMARILDLLSEGDLEMWVSDNPLKDVFLDGTPVMNADGSLNFESVQVDWRPGTPNQEYIPGFPSVKSEIAVGVELRQATPWVRAITNTQLTAVSIRLATPALTKTNNANGDTGGHRIDYAFDLATDGGAFQEVFRGAMAGKTKSKYERGHRIDLPPATTGWSLRVRRISPDSDTQYIQDKLMVQAITEIIDAKLRYPYSAVVGIALDAQQFRSIPSRAYRVWGRIIRIPTNYNPKTRAYSGVWDGTFKMGWTNNPAWIYYDMATNRRYGLGRRIDESRVDKWSLYKIAQYCDELVPDGKGGTEPRFTCTVYLQQKADAYKVMRDLASVFRGISYWAGGAIVGLADQPEDPVFTYTNANVKDGKFTYNGTGKKARHTMALVSWSNLDNFGKGEVTPVIDEEGIIRYGIQPTNVTAFGATSESQAMRVGRWILASELLETDACSWDVGLDGTLVAPGKIVRVLDADRSGRRLGGRISAAGGNWITVDALPDVLPVPGDKLVTINPQGAAQENIVASVDAGLKRITVTAPFGAAPVAHSVWGLETAQVAPQLMRILGVADNGDGSYSVSALQHEPGKFAQVEHGVKVEPKPISVLPSNAIGAPSAVTLTATERAGEVLASTVVNADWEAVPGASAYYIQWKRGDGEWSPPEKLVGTNADLENTFPGDHWARVWTVNQAGIASPFTLSNKLVVADQSLKPGFVAALNSSIAAALQTAENAQATADGAVESFWQPTPPSIGPAAGQAKEGDIWFDTDNGNRMHRVVGAAWVDASDDALAQAIAAASTAQATADGKVRLFVSPSAPTSGQSLHDQWFNTTTAVLMYWTGSAWAPVADQTSMASDQMVLNPYFEQGMLHWVQDSNWYAETSANAAITGTGMVHAAHAIVNSRLRSTRSFPVSPGQRVFVTGMARNIGGSATGDLAIGILWYDAAGNEVGEASGAFSKSTPMPGTEWRQLTRTCYAPNRAVLGRVHATVWNHTAGFWAVDNIRCKLIDDNAAVSPSGDNMVPNHAFSQDADLWPVAIGNNEVGAPIAAGWDVGEASGTLRTSIQTGLEPNGGGRRLFIGNIEGVSAPGDYSYTNVHSRQKFSVVQGERFYIETSVQVDIGNLMPAGLNFVKYVGLWCYNSNDQYNGFVGCTGGLNSLVWAGTVDIPAGTAYVRVGAGAHWSNTTSSAINVPWATAHMRVHWIKIRRVANLDQGLIEHGNIYGKTANADLYDYEGIRRVGLRVKGSRQILGGPRNSRVSLVAGVASVRTTTALTATSAGVVSVNAHALELNGETVHYSAVTNAVTGLAVGVTYVIFTIDPYLDGGVRTYYAQTSVLSAQQAGDGCVFIGNITIPSSGSSGGGDGGGGNPGDWCVDYDSVLPDGRLVRELRLGDLVECVDVTTGVVSVVPLLAMGFGEEECFRLVTDDQCSVIQSRSTPMDLPDGRVVRTEDVLGCEVYTNREGEVRKTVVSELEFVGLRRVCKPDFGNRMFFAGESADATIATHNVQYKP